MSPFILFITSLAVALVALTLGAAALTRTMRFNVVADTAADTEARRAHRRWMVVGIGSLLLLIVATASFFYIWIACAGEC